MYKNILVAYDRSDPALHAVRTAVQLATENKGAHLSIVSVMPSMQQTFAFSDISSDPASPLNAYEDPSVIDEAEAQVGKRQKEEIANLLADEITPLEAGRVSFDVEFSPSPAFGLLTYCKDRSCDLIVMGNRGLGALRGMLGSVSFSVLRSSAVPVLVVK